MHLGIDLGTTRTVVAVADRGNYPVVSFSDQFGDSVDHVPSVVAEVDGRLVHGFEAVAAGSTGAPTLRSFKRLLADPEVSASTPVTIGAVTTTILELMTDFLVALRAALRTRSNIGAQLAAAPEGRCVVAVPAHAHSNQRFLTLEAFRRAGFDPVALVNEPSAAGFEYTHRQARTLNSKRTRIVVYDLGGGTFDASLVRVDGTAHEILASVGHNRLGGDDFDTILAEVALAREGLSLADLTELQRALLLDDCREAKEQLAPQSRRIALDIGDATVMIPVAEFYDAVSPLIERTVETMAPLVGGLDDDGVDLTDIAGIYLVGGGSTLPMVARVLRERFGRRTHRSPYPAASTAIGLAIAADPDAGYSLDDRLSRGFGVFREAHDGAQVQFDPVFQRDAQVSGDQSTVVTRRYRAAHNVGWFRFVEYADLDAAGQPSGDLVPFGEIRFPFDQVLQTGEKLPRNLAVERIGSGPLVEERYEIDRFGMVQVSITDLDTGYVLTNSLGR